MRLCVSHMWAVGIGRGGPRVQGPEQSPPDPGKVTAAHASKVFVETVNSSQRIWQPNNCNWTSDHKHCKRGGGVNAQTCLVCFPNTLWEGWFQIIRFSCLENSLLFLLCNSGPTNMIVIIKCRPNLRNDAFFCTDIHSLHYRCSRLAEFCLMSLHFYRWLPLRFAGCPQPPSLCWRDRDTTSVLVAMDWHRAHLIPHHTGLAWKRKSD